MNDQVAIIDADNHYFETEDCCTRYIPDEYALRTVRVVEDGNAGQIMVGDRPLSYVNHNMLRGVAPAGARAGYFAGKKVSFHDGEEETKEEILEMVEPRTVPAYQNRQARLGLVDQQGVEAAVLLPTLGVLFEQDLLDDAPALMATVTSFNRWLEEDWGFGTEGRIYGVPMISLSDVEAAVAELDRVTALGAKIVNLKMGPVLGRSPADPFFDPFWARINESGVAVSFHIGGAGYLSYSAEWSEHKDVSIREYSPFQMLICHGDRLIADTLGALVLHNLFGRFPNVKIMSIENGSSWVPDLLKNMEKAVMMGRNGNFVGGKLSESPTEYFRNHVYVCPYHEDDIDLLVAKIGASQVLLGSDFPHPEGVAEPRDFLAGLGGLTEGERQAICRDNAAALLGIS